MLLLHSLAKRPNLEMKTRAKQLLGYLLLAFSLPIRFNLRFLTKI